MLSESIHYPTVIQVVQKSLEEVRLTESARVRTRSYSGGMKRRLSVAIALIGEPKLVILDEPVNRVDFVIFQSFQPFEPFPYYSLLFEPYIRK